MICIRYDPVLSVNFGTSSQGRFPCFLRGLHLGLFCVKFEQYLFMFGRGLFIIAQGFHMKGVRTIKDFLVSCISLRFFSYLFKFKLKLSLLWIFENIGLIPEVQTFLSF